MRHNIAVRIARCGALILAAIGGPALGQSTAPSSVTPPTLRPPPTGGDAPPALPPAPGLTPPAGSAALTVRAGRIEVIGGFATMAAQTQAITAPLVGRVVTLAQIYAAASGIEAAYVRRGYILARATVPPQRIEPGGTIRIVMVDGFVEAVDVAGLPARVRYPARLRTAALVGRRQPTLAMLETPIVLAGEIPGLSLVSTLTRGDQAGGTRLILTGRQVPVSGSVSIDNSLAPSLDRYAMTAQLSLNSLLGLGEQIYGYAVTGYDLPRAFRDDAPVRVLGGGASLPIGDGRLSLNPEATASRTQPLPQSGVPRIRGTLRRLTMRAGYVLAKTRRRSLTGGLTVEQIRENNQAIDFATALSLDRFMAARVQLSWSDLFPRGGGYALTAQLSQGMGGLGARGGSPIPISRQGADANFTKLNATARLYRPLSRRLGLALTARAQTAFGQPLFRSEQAVLEGADALSSYYGGITAVDGSVTLRGELSRGLAPLHALQLTPYVFGAAGRGWIARPTAVEVGRYTLWNPGVGVRGGITGTRIGFGLEYGHGFSGERRFDGVDRVAFSLTLGV